MLLTTAHYNDDDQVTGSNSLSTMKYEVILTLSLASSYLAKGKETDLQIIDNSQVLFNQDEGSYD